MQTQVVRSMSGDAVVTVEGSFDGKDADRLHSIATNLATGGPVTLDFHKVRSPSDAAVAHLAMQLRATRRVVMVGLSQHHHRLLKLVGLARVTNAG